LWGGVAYWVQIPAWLVVERKGEKGSEKKMREKISHEMMV
jgi:hypothetical protein